MTRNRRETSAAQIRRQAALCSGQVLEGSAMGSKAARDAAVPAARRLAQVCVPPASVIHTYTNTCQSSGMSLPLGDE